jgi:hypothetical protein
MQLASTPSLYGPLARLIVTTVDASSTPRASSSPHRLFAGINVDRGTSWARVEDAIRAARQLSADRPNGERVPAALVAREGDGFVVRRALLQPMGADGRPAGGPVPVHLEPSGARTTVIGVDRSVPVHSGVAALVDGAWGPVALAR